MWGYFMGTPICGNCGETYKDGHECKPERVIDFTAWKESRNLPSDITRYLNSKEGQFDQFYAERERKKGKVKT